MRSPFLFIFLVALVALGSTAARAALFLQKDSRSPDGTIVFAIQYPPTVKDTYGRVQGCLLRAKTRKRLTDFFFLPGTDAEMYHPGTYVFDNYHVFGYVWSNDSTHLAIVHNGRHWSDVLPFRLRKSVVEELKMPGLEAPFELRFQDILRGIHGGMDADLWTRRNELVVTNFHEAKISETGNLDHDWKYACQRAMISFDCGGRPTVQRTRYFLREEE